MRELGLYALLYILAGLWFGGAAFQLGAAFLDWCEQRPTQEARTTALILALVFWPVTLGAIVLKHAWLILFFTTKGGLKAPGYLWRGLGFLKRGVLDLLGIQPKVDLPKARVIK